MMHMLQPDERELESPLVVAVKPDSLVADCFAIPAFGIGGRRACLERRFGRGNQSRLFLVFRQQCSDLDCPRAPTLY